MANGFFKARPHFENRQIVQWMGESIHLSGQTNFELGGFNSYIYDSYEDFLNGVSGATFLSLPLSAATDPISGWSNQTVFQPGIVRVIPPHAVFFSGNTNVITATTQEDVTNYIATSFDSQGTIVWKPLSGLTSMSGSCTPDFYVGTIHPCGTGGTVTIQGNLLVRGDTISATTIIETETILVEDNNIELNYGGNHTTAIGGGITVLSGISNTQDSTITTDSNGVFVFNPGLSTPYLNISNVLTGETISLLAITSGGTVVEGTSMYSDICESCSGFFTSSGFTVDTGTTVISVSESLEPIGVDCTTPKCCSQWTITYRDGERTKQQLVTTNYELVLKYEKAYNAHVRCSDSNNTGTNYGGKDWTTDVTTESIPTYDTKPTSFIPIGVVYEDIRPTSSTVNIIREAWKVNLRDTAYTEVTKSDFIAISDSSQIKVENTINTVIDDTSQGEILGSTEGYVDGSNRVLMVSSHDSTIKDASMSSIISSESSVISGGTSGTTIISARNVIATDSYTTYTDNLRATNDVYATTFYGDGSNLTGVGFSGNTSGSCITDLYVSNLYGCSPITIHNSIISDTVTVDNDITNTIVFGGNHLYTGSSVTHGSNADGNIILGGNGNKLTPFQTGLYNTIIGGDDNEIGGVTRSDRNTIIGSTDSLISNVFGSGNGSVVLGGKTNRVFSSPQTSVIGGSSNRVGAGSQSSILGGSNNVLNNANRTVILGGDGITGDTNDTVYVPYLNISNVNTGTAVGNLVIDSSGNVITGSTSGLTNYWIVENDGIKDIIGGHTISSGPNSIIAGGSGNTITNDVNNTFPPKYSGIFAGLNNSISASGSIGNNNFYSGSKSVILGGENNLISGHTFASILGGYNNEIYTSAGYNAIIGGEFNKLGAGYSVILGGRQNTLGSVNEDSFILGGLSNTILKTGSGLGVLNSAGLDNGGIIGGRNNTITGVTVTSNNDGGTIIGGLNNKLLNTQSSNSMWYSGIILGADNTITSTQNTGGIGSSGSNDGNLASLIIGGQENSLTDSDRSLILGGYQNTLLNSQNSLVLGGQNITGTTSDTVYVPNLNIGTVGVGVSINNLGIDADGNVTTGSTGGGSSFWEYGNGDSNSLIDINGDHYQSSASDYGMMAGGQNNSGNTSTHAFIGGGSGNTFTDANYSGIIGGINNDISGFSERSVIIGGRDNYLGNTTGSVILGGVGIQGTTSDTTYVTRFNIGSLDGTSPIFNLGMDSQGFVVTGTTGGGGTDTVSATTTTIDFTAPKIFHKFTNQATGNISEDLTGAKLGVVQKIYHNDSVEPTYPAGWVLMGDGIYFTSQLNIIYCEWAEGSRVEYWYVQEQ